MSEQQFSGVRFATHYIMTPISSETGLPSGESVRVCNLVLDSGLAALGTATAYSSISMGTSTITTDVSQKGLITPVSTIDIAQAVTRTFNTFEDGVAKSTTTHNVLFKNINFPSTERNIEISEIGLDGLTRAVYETPLRIGLKDWVSVTAVLEYTYLPDQESTIPVQINAGTYPEEMVIPYTAKTRPDPQNPTAQTGKGYGTSGTVTCKLWDGVSTAEDPKTTTITGVTITPTLMGSENRWVFKVSGAWNVMSTIKGVVLTDTNNAINTLIEYPQGLVFEEDDTVVLSFSFNWSR